MTRNRLSKVRHLAVALVLGNLALIGLLGLVLPEAALAALPVLAIFLAPLSAAAVEAALSGECDNTKPAGSARPARLGFGRALHHAA